MKNTRIRLTALIALTLAFAILLTSCGVVGDFVLRSSFAVKAAGSENKPEAAESETLIDTQSETQVIESPESEEVVGASVEVETDFGIRPPEVSGELSTPLVWRVTDPRTEGVLYLLGSMHAGLEDMCLFPEEIYDAFDECDMLAVENDVIEFEKNAAKGVEGMRMLVYQDGGKISEHISGDLYDAAADILEEAGYPSSFMDFYMPILWQQVIDEILTENTPYKYENGVDRYFLTEAKRLGKVVVEVEDPLDVYRRLAGLSTRTQEIMLEDEVDPGYIASFEDGIATLYEAWKSGDPEAIGRALMMIEDDESDTSETSETSETSGTSDIDGESGTAAQTVDYRCKTV